MSKTQAPFVVRQKNGWPIRFKSNLSGKSFELVGGDDEATEFTSVADAEWMLDVHNLRPDQYEICPAEVTKKSERKKYDQTTRSEN